MHPSNLHAQPHSLVGIAHAILPEDGQGIPILILSSLEFFELGICVARLGQLLPITFQAVLAASSHQSSSPLRWRRCQQFLWPHDLADTGPAAVDSAAIEILWPPTLILLLLFPVGIPMPALAFSSARLLQVWWPLRPRWATRVGGAEAVQKATWPLRGPSGGSCSFSAEPAALATVGASTSKGSPTSTSRLARGAIQEALPGTEGSGGEQKQRWAQVSSVRFASGMCPPPHRRP
mmetsp:Transcript_29714/g.74659  ORF Transcript_29714/g.74659 Transcript_29714/m.74659 type:complete len:235 (+) Transcript_29714:1311-2015(+)